MKFSFLAFGLFTAGATLASAAIERSVSRSFPAEEVKVLQAVLDGGTIRVETAAAGQPCLLEIRQIIDTNSGEEAEELLKNLHLEVGQENGVLHLESRYETGLADIWKARRVKINLVAHVPHDTVLKLRTGGGSIQVKDHAALVEARTSGGNIRTGRIQGPATLSTSGGDIKVVACTGELRANTSGGDITVDEGGAMELRTSGGDITVAAAASGVRANTSGGDVKVTFVGQPERASELRTSGGDIVVTLPKKTAFEVEASTSGGRVKVAEAVGLKAASVHRASVKGSIGSGGPTLVATSSGGHVRLERSE